MNNWIKPMTEEELVIVRAWCIQLVKALKKVSIQTWFHMDRQIWVLTIRVGMGHKPSCQLKASAPAIAGWDDDRRQREIEWYLEEFQSYFRYRKGR